jgi:hypothetical protein
MSRSLAEDAARWETGLLTLDELESLHPGEDVRRLVDLSGLLAAVGEMPTPDPAAAWAAFQDQLPERLRPVERIQRRFRRALVPIMAAAALGGTSVAYAAGVEPVRHGVDRIAHNVADLFNRDDGNQGNVDNGGQGDVSGGGRGDSDESDEGNAGSGESDSDQSNDGNTGTNEGNEGSEGNEGNEGGEDDQGNIGADQDEEGNGGTNEDDTQGDEGNTGTGDSSEGDQGNTGTNE